MKNICHYDAAAAGSIGTPRYGFELGAELFAYLLGSYIAALAYYRKLSKSVFQCKGGNKPHGRSGITVALKLRENAIAYVSGRIVFRKPQIAVAHEAFVTAEYFCVKRGVFAVSYNGTVNVDKDIFTFYYHMKHPKNGGPQGAAGII